MNTEPFLTLIDRLTKPTPGTIDRDDGPELRTQDGLLQQLREAVFGGMEKGGAGSAMGSKPPIDSAALDLLDEITTQAAEVLAIVLHTPTPFGHAEDYVTSWAARTDESKMYTVSEKRQHPDSMVDKWRAQKDMRPAVYDELIQLSAYNLAKRWVERLEGFFEPPETWAIQAPCPVCSERYTHRVTDGQHIRSDALSFAKDKVTGRTVLARCSACGVTWPPVMFDWLRRAIGIAEGAVVEETKKPRRQQGEPTDLPDGSYRFVDGEWVDSATRQTIPAST